MPNSETMEQLEQIETLEPVYELLEILIARYGSAGVAAAMFAESAGIPFTSIIVLLTAGTMIKSESVSFWSLMISSTIGITLGSIFSYFVGLLGSMAGTAVKSGIFHHYPNPSAVKPEQSKSKLLILWQKYGILSIFMAQLWGFTRTFGSFPAGAMHINFILFVVYTFLGGLLFSSAYIATSIVLTGTMGATLNLFRAVIDISPWLFILVLVVLIIIACLVIYRYRTGSFLNLNRFWSWLKGVIGCK